MSTPDLAALYQRHRHAMYLKAWSVLNGTGYEDDADDVVMNVMVSLMEHPPPAVDNWEAFLVRAAGNKAIDFLRSAPTKHAGGPIQDDDVVDRTVSLADEVTERIDGQRQGALLWDDLAVLEPRERQIVWQYKGLGVPRSEVAAEFGISASRVSQISTSALRTLGDKLLEEGFQR